MYIHFANKKLANIYYTGNSESNTYSKAVIQAYINKITFMSYATDLQSLQAMESWHLEHIKKNGQKIYSIRLTKRRRLICTINKDTECSILDLKDSSK